MKAVVLAAGKGTRMLPITMKKPKPLVKVAGKPLLHFIVKHLDEAGYDEIGIVVGYKRQMVEDWLDSKGCDCDLIVQEEQTGTGSAVAVCKDFAGGDDFIVTMGDNLYSPRDFRRLKDMGGNCISATKGDPARYGAVVKENGFLRRIVEKPQEYVSSLINTGLYRFTSEIFDALGRIDKSPRGELEITDAINLLAEGNHVRVMELKDYWLDLARPEDIYDISEFILEEVK